MNDSRTGDLISTPIPSHLFKKIEQRAEEMGFDSALDYILFVLTEIVTQPEKQVQPFTEEEEEQVTQHLRDLGYI